MFKFNVLTLCLMLMSCGSNVPSLKEQSLPAPPKPLSSSEAVLPAEVVPFSSGFLERIKKAERLDEIVMLKHVAPLETNESVLVNSISELLVNDQMIITLDIQTNVVYAFDWSGRFLQQFGNPGQGPGEYAHLSSMMIDQDQLVLLDNQARFHVYGLDGSVIWSTPVGLGRQIYPVGRFLIQDKNLYVTNIAARALDAPWHAKIKFEQGAYEVITGFGERTTFEAAPKLNFFHTAIAIVNDHIWYGSPFDSSISVFEKSGRLVATLNEGRKHINRLKPEMLVELNSSDAILETIREHQAIKHIHKVGQIVLVQVGNSFDIYDINGNLLRLGLRGGFIGNVAAVDQTTFAAELPARVFRQLSNTHALLSTAAVTVGDDDNPVVLFLEFNFE